MNFTGKIKCTKCGNNFGVRRDIYEDRIKEAGDEKKLLASYVCRSCKKNGGPQKNDTSASVKNDIKIDTKNNVPLVGATTLILNNKENIEFATKNGCFRPDIHLDNNKFCDVCHLKEHCIASTKKLRKIEKKPKISS